MRSTIGLLSLLFLTACYNSETFQTDYVASTCDWYDRCELLEVLDYEDTQDCMDEILSETVDGLAGAQYCTDFSRPDAKECITQLDARGCEEGFTQPSACLDACPEAS